MRRTTNPTWARPVGPGGYRVRQRMAQATEIRNLLPKLVRDAEIHREAEIRQARHNARKGR